MNTENSMLKFLKSGNYIKYFKNYRNLIKNSRQNLRTICLILTTNVKIVFIKNLP